MNSSTLIIRTYLLRKSCGELFTARIDPRVHNGGSAITTGFPINVWTVGFVYLATVVFSRV